MNAARIGRIRRTIVTVLSFMLISSASHLIRAQGTNATLTGRVIDPGGSVIAGSEVTVRNVSTGVAVVVKTNEDGLYRVTNLLPGTYEVAAISQGFRREVKSGITLQVGDQISVDLQLQLGAVSESVTVAANGIAIDTTTSTLGQVVQSQQVADLPLNGRNFLQMASLTPGAVPILGTHDSLSAQLIGNSGVSVHVAGSRDDANSFLLDGIETRQPWVGNAGVLPSIDAIQEFKVDRGIYPANLGQGIGVVETATKSGTNSFHGSLYEFVRNDMFDAANYFDVIGKPPFRENQFGGSFGGPVLVPHVYDGKDKTFFFFAYEGLRTRKGLTLNGNFPDRTQLTGDFSAVATKIYDPATNQQFNNSACLSLYGGVLKQNVICPANFSSVAVNYEPYIPKPNMSVPGLNYVTRVSSKNDYDQEIARIDQTFSAKDSFFGRLLLTGSGALRPGIAPYFGSTVDLSNANVALRETHIFSSNIVNTATLGFNRATLANPIQNTPTNVGAAIGLQHLDLARSDWGVPQVSIVGYTGTGQSPLNQGSTTNMFEGTEALDIQRGKHQIETGIDLRYYQYQIFQSLLRQGLAVFTGTQTAQVVAGKPQAGTGLPLADYLLGRVTAYPYDHGSIHDHSTSKNWSTWVQDNWRVSPSLTLNLGLRWEYDSPWVEKDGQGGFFDASTPGGIIRLLSDPKKFGYNFTSPYITVGGARPGIRKPQYTNFAPRVGFAYSAPKGYVVRAGAGIFYGTGLANDETQFAMFLPPFIISPTIASGSQWNTLFPDVTSANFQFSGLLSPFSIQPNAKRPYVEQWGLSVDKTFAGMTFEVGYEGSHGLHNWERININQATLPAPNDPNAATIPDIQSRRPFPNFGDVLQASWNEFSHYNALETSVNRRFNNGLSFTVSYTYSRNLDTTSGGGGNASVHQNMHDTRADYAASSFDTPNVFTFAHSYALPFGKGRKFAGKANPVVDALIGGWQINGILTLLSGQPYTVTAAGSNPEVGGFAVERANLSGNPNLPSGQRTIKHWFNTAAFSAPVQGTFGNSGRNVVKAPPLRDYDFSLFKNFHFGERTALQFRAETFNLLNHPPFNAPGLDVTTPATFGQITTARDPREIQLALKLTF